MSEKEISKATDCEVKPGPRIALIISKDRIESYRLIADSDTETKEASAIMERIAPALDLIDATLAACRIRKRLINPVDQRVYQFTKSEVPENT